jgi:hypothetical protein
VIGNPHSKPTPDRWRRSRRTPSRSAQTEAVGRTHPRPIHQGPAGQIPAVVIVHEIKAAYRHEEGASPEVQPGDKVILYPDLLDPPFGCMRAFDGLFYLADLGAEGEAKTAGVKTIVGLCRSFVS